MTDTITHALAHENILHLRTILALEERTWLVIATEWPDEDPAEDAYPPMQVHIGPMNKTEAERLFKEIGDTERYLVELIELHSETDELRQEIFNR